MTEKKATICACVSRSFINKDNAVAIAATMENNGYDVKIEADLCRKIMQVSPDMEDIANGVIIACNTRAIRSHLDWLGLKPHQMADMRNNSVESILSVFNITYSGDNTKDKYLNIIERFPVENGTDAWYPILDKEKCVECGKCHDFCLFGVYTIENKQVRVTQPQNCKNNCPACARMCPEKAIIFPKYEKSPINGGIDEEETFNPEEMDKMYNERLRMRLQQRRSSVPLFKKNSNNQ